VTILDGAHNPAKIAALIKTLDALRIPKTRLIAIFTCKETKDARNMLKILSPRCQSVFLPRILSDERLIAPETLEHMLSNGQVFPSISSALTAARTAVEHNGNVICTGSLRLVGRIMEHEHVKI
jgi:folylpolyglutamate synthase/dihydropteroate synthase